MASGVKGNFYGVADVPTPPSPWPPAEMIVLARRSSNGNRGVFSYSYGGGLAAPDPLVEGSGEWPITGADLGFALGHIAIREDPSLLVGNMALVRWISGANGSIAPPKIAVWDWFGTGATYTWTGTSTSTPNQRYEIGGVLWYDGWLWWVEYQGTFGNPNPPTVRLWRARPNLKHDGALPEEIGTEDGPELVRTVTSTVRLKVWQRVYLVPGWVLILHSDATTQPTHVIAIAMDGSDERAGTSSNYSGPSLAFKNRDIAVALLPGSATQFYSGLGDASTEGRPYAAGAVATISVTGTFADITEALTVDDSAASGRVVNGVFRPGGDLLSHSSRVGDPGGGPFVCYHSATGPGISSRVQLDELPLGWGFEPDGIFPVEPT